MMRMKEVVLKSHSSQRQIGRLLVTGPTTVTAAHFDLPSEVEVIDPNQYVATLADGAKLEMEFWVDRGKGYRTVERGRDEATALDFLQIDAVFMPVRKVNYSVEEALSAAASILVDLLNPLKDISLEAIDVESSTDDDPTSQIPIEELQLSVRAYNCLKRAQVNSVADLLDYTQEDLLEIKNFGQKSAEEVIEALQKRLGITLPHEKSAKPSWYKVGGKR